ncbi:phosphatase PAP2 family protein [Chryseobacterium paridis]|uniref:Phosphatase PAP2 family protein n=1 Tax=Chryseobacterium paridis TaxID=2800328 RepID=A0ABS1FWJ3_9FLAO|nr:phosphatase PAP2 family protein [Chryseobacterium paridis]MBK1896807.1 phosphatase PAP2 family protein [Chryseobacterium paridis]
MKKIRLILLPISIWVSSQNSDSIVLKKKAISQNYTLKDGSVRTYPKPKLFEFITRVPKDFIDTNKDFVAKDHAYYLGGAVAGTLILLPFDQKLIDNSRELGDRMGMSADNNYNKVGGLIKIPKDIGSGLYLIGNGSTVVLLGIGFATYGLIKDDYRAQATASGLMESLILSGVFSQTIKRITGRESPFIAIQNGNSGGHWTPFPSFSAFANDTSRYDAMPSGHLTTFMSAITVIADNYPDAGWIKPVGYTLAGALAFQMMQSQVHWASDYPLALLMGYFIGKTISKNRYTSSEFSAGNVKYKINLTASNSFGYNMAGVKLTF